jgi:probable DNA repair protein
MPLPAEPLKSALAEGALVVTPNRRLARALVALHDDAERAAGRAAWPTVRALPWEAWLVALWQDALAAGVAGDARLRSRLQSAHAWQRIVAPRALLDAQGAAELAAEAWTLAHAWGSGGSSWRAFAGGDDDPGTFAQWADVYAAQLGRAGAIDPAQLPDRLARCAPHVRAWKDARVVLAGFVELSPQQQRLQGALQAAGMRIGRCDTLPQRAARIGRAEAPTPREELVLALEWARVRALADPEASIGIAVLDLAARRAEVRALADEVLCPALQWPGNEEAPRPYNVSLGAALSEHALVAAALDLIALALGSLPLGRAAALLRSPYLSGASGAWMKRARLEADWLEQGRGAIELGEAIAGLERVDPSLARRWREARGAHRMPSSASPRIWAEAWRAWLEAAGWPGERTLGSAEYQTRAAWDDALAEFATLGGVAGRFNRAEALGALRAQIGATIFQPQSPPARIQILGVLEAAGVPFDALWVAGFAAESWPPPPRQHPLLPPLWQRDHDVPNATAARALAFAQAITDQFARAAPDVVFSHARCVDDHPRAPSTLAPDGPPLEVAELRRASTASAQRDAAPALETVPDDRAPPLPPQSRAPGGARLIEAQSDCPFQAVAGFRLRAEPWPTPVDGLSPIERGKLIHEAFAAFWRDVGDQATLLGLDDSALRTRIDRAVAEAARVLPAPRWRALSPLVAAGEAARLARALGEWIETYERKRPPFRVAEVEAAAAITLAGLDLRLRLDRVDALASGGTAIIDYKSGYAKQPECWFEPRPQAPQLALYALARRAATPTQNVRAVTYAQLKPGEIKAIGLAADAAAWPALKQPSALKRAGVADWAAMETRWIESLGALAAEIAAGEAAVAPRDDKTCRLCGRQPFCRIGGTGHETGDDDTDE